MQLTEQEMFAILIERYYTYQNCKVFQEQKDFAETLKAFVEKFTEGNSTIKPKEEPKPKTVGERLYEQLANATAEGNLEAVTIYSQAIQRLS
jgi:hypothetical protein